MNVQQKRFADEWLIDFNATQAAIRAGYSPNGASVQGCRLLEMPTVIEYITEMQEKMNSKLEVTREAVIQELARVGLVDIRNIFNGSRLRSIDTLDDDTAAAVSSVEVVTNTHRDGEDTYVDYTHKIKLHNKVQALKELGQHFNIYEDHQKSGAGEMHVHFDSKDEKA